MGDDPYNEMSLLGGEQLWRYIHPLTLEFRDTQREATYVAEFTAARRYTDMWWSLLSLLMILVVLLRGASVRMSLPLTASHIALRVLPVLAVVLLPAEAYVRKRPVLMKGVRAARATLFLYTVFVHGVNASGDGWYPLCVESLLSSALVPIGYQMLFKQHVVWDTCMLLVVGVAVCAPGGLCTQTAPLAVRVYGAFLQALQSKARAVARLLLLPQLPPTGSGGAGLERGGGGGLGLLLELPAPLSVDAAHRRCVRSVLALLPLLCVLAPSAALYCLQLHSRSLALHARGVHVVHGSLQVGFWVTQHLVLLAACFVAYLALASYFVV